MTRPEAGETGAGDAARTRLLAAGLGTAAAASAAYGAFWLNGSGPP